MITVSKQLGKFRDRFVFQYQSRTADGAGGWTNSWVDDLTVWGMKRPMSASQELDNSLIEGKEAFKFTIRFSNDFAYTLSNDYRIKHGSTFYNIHSVTVVEDQDHYYEIVGWKI